MAHEQAKQEFSLPFMIVSPADVAKLLRELEDVDDFLLQAASRQPGAKSPDLPRSSQLLDSFVTLNKIDLHKPGERRDAAKFLTGLKQNGPTIHISFANDPSAAFMEKIVGWFRGNIHPLLLVRIGLEPMVGAGCVLRTPNRLFDLSLRRKFIAHQSDLIELLKASSARGEHVG